MSLRELIQSFSVCWCGEDATPPQPYFTNVLGCLSDVLFNIGVETLSLLIGLGFKTSSSDTRAMGRVLDVVCCDLN